MISLLILLKIISIKSESPINNLDNYVTYKTEISSNYILTEKINDSNIFFANDSQYSISKEGEISFLQSFKKLEDKSSMYIDSENDIIYYSCTSQNLFSTSKNEKYNNNSLNYIKEKCSITILKDSSQNIYPILSIVTYNYFLLFCEKKINYLKLKFNDKYELDQSFQFSGDSCSISTEAEISKCISIYENTYILCAVRVNTIIVSIIDSAFSKFENQKYIHGQNNSFKQFIFFSYNDEKGIVISRQGNTKKLFVTTVEVSLKNYEIKALNETNFESDLDLNNIGLAVYDEGVFIGTILKEFIYIYDVKIKKKTNYLKIEKKDTIEQIGLISFEENIVGILFRSLNQKDNLYYISYVIIEFPEQLNCNTQNFTAYSNENLNVDLSTIFPYYQNAYLNENPLNFEFSDKYLTAIAPNNGKHKTTIYYLYNNINVNIYLRDPTCHFNYQICNEACNSCNIFSDDSTNTLCNDCTKNYAYLINDTSQCEKNNKNISLYYYNSTDKVFNKCYDTCLYCSKEGNITNNNCDVCLNENCRKSYMKEKQCILCDNNNVLFYYSNTEGSICLDESIIQCPDDYPFLIKENNECTSSCPTKFPIKLNNECLDECPTEKGYIKYNNKCYCNNQYIYYYDEDNNNNLICIIDSNECPKKYPILNESTKECEKKNEKEIIFNGETIEECPSLTRKVNKEEYNTCECIYAYYMIDDIIYCTSTKLCNKNNNEYKLLIKDKNLCVKKCDSEYPIEFENYCLKKCPNNYIIYNNKCMKIPFNNVNENVTIEIYDSFTVMKSESFIAQTYDSSIKSTNDANSYGNLSSIDFGECINVLKEKNNIPEDENLIIIKIDINKENSVTDQVEYSISTKEGKNLDLNDCKDIEIKIENTVKMTSEELNLDKAKEALQYGYDIYNAKDSFYNSICTIFTNGNGTDVPLENRKSDYYKNISFCDINCYYDGINLDTLRVKCNCKIKTNENTDNNGFSVQSLRNEFTSVISNSNIRVFICYKNIFTKKIIKNYAFWIIFICISGEIICTILYGITGFEPILDKIKKAKEFYELDKIIEENEKMETYKKKFNRKRNSLYPRISINGNEINLQKLKLQNNIINNNNDSQNKSSNVYNNSTARIINPPKNPPIRRRMNETKNSECTILPEKNLSTQTIEINLSIPNDENKINKSDNHLACVLKKQFSGVSKISNKKEKNKKLGLLTHKKKKKIKKQFNEKYNPESMLNGNEIIIHSNRLKIIKTTSNDKEKIKFTNTTEKTNKEKEDEVLHKTDEQFNALNYQNAIKYDKRNFLKIYYGFLKYSQLIIFSFITDTDYNLRYIKIILCVFSFIGYFFFNTLFFTDKTMSDIYENKGKYHFIYSIPKSLFSSLCCILINMLLKFISLSNKQIIELTKEKDPHKEERILYKLIKCLKIKLVFFFLLVYLFSGVFWYYVSAFCSVYINTQKHLMKNSILSFVESMIYPFGICLITTCLRIFSLRFKIKIIFFISKIMQKL